MDKIKLLKKVLYGHIAIYVIVNAGLVFLYYYLNKTLYESSSLPWYLWSIGGWAIGLVVHIIGTIKDTSRLKTTTTNI